MSNQQTRHGMARLALATFGVMLLGGCTHADPASLELFLTDLLRNAAAALLL
jgi:hypothetical protein